MLYMPWSAHGNARSCSLLFPHYNSKQEDGKGQMEEIIQSEGSVAATKTPIPGEKSSGGGSYVRPPLLYCAYVCTSHRYLLTVYAAGVSHPHPAPVVKYGTNECIT